MKRKLKRNKSNVKTKILKRDVSVIQLSDGVAIDNSQIDENSPRNKSALWSKPISPKKQSEFKLPVINLSTPTKSSISPVKRQRMKDSDSGFVKCITNNGNERDVWSSILSYIPITE